MKEWGSEHDEFIKALKGKDNRELERLASKLDPNVSHPFRDGHYSLLFHASVDNNSDAFRVLVERGADPAWKNQHGQMVLKLLVNRNQISMVEMSLKKLRGNTEAKDAFVNHTIDSGWTSLMSCAEQGRHEIAKLLVENGADVSKAMGTGWTALHAAAKVENVKTLELLLKNGANKDARANHRDYGKNLTAKDVTNSKAVHDILDKY